MHFRLMLHAVRQHVFGSVGHVLWLDVTWEMYPHVSCNMAKVKAISRLPHIRTIILTDSTLLNGVHNEITHTVEMLLRVQRASPHINWVVDRSVESTIAGPVSLDVG